MGEFLLSAMLTYANAPLQVSAVARKERGGGPKNGDRECVASILLPLFSLKSTLRKQMNTPSSPPPPPLYGTRFCSINLFIREGGTSSSSSSSSSSYCLVNRSFRECWIKKCLIISHFWPYALCSTTFVFPQEVTSRKFIAHEFSLFFLRSEVFVSGRLFSLDFRPEEGFIKSLAVNRDAPGQKNPITRVVFIFCAIRTKKKSFLNEVSINPDRCKSTSPPHSVFPDIALRKNHAKVGREKRARDSYSQPTAVVRREKCVRVLSWGGKGQKRCGLSG